jgi:16S rRNA (adenine1518-N6/adenine1519-N6)-dimethyltransferase
MEINLNNVKKLAKQYGVHPRARVGQNFLISQTVADQILSTANLNKKDVVLEVGGGLGLFTKQLASRCQKVVTVEMDERLVVALQKVAGNVEVVAGDILRIHPNLIPGPYKIVANLPYQITSIFLRTFLEKENQPVSMTLLLQKEVGECLVDLRKSSLLSLSVRFYSQPEIVAVVGRENFWPSPKVDSVIINLKNINRGVDKVDRELFWQLARIGFSSKRKQLAKNLAAGLNLDHKKLKNWLKKQGFNEKVRAEDLNLEQWQELSRKWTIFPFTDQ